MAIEIGGRQWDITQSIFPGGEVHVRLSEGHYYKQCGSNPIEVVAYLKNGDDIMEMLLVCDAIRQWGYKEIDLVIPYVPYARQDRVCNKGEAFSIQVMARLINSIGASRVTIDDPHSDVTTALINNVRVNEQHELVCPTILYEKNLVCPDAGAEKKIQKLKRPYIMATKVRDPKTGEISHTRIYDHDESENEKFDMTRPYIIVDDICDGGRTFIEIAKAIRNEMYDKARVELYVTHGIFSKGFDVFEGIIDKIYWYECGELKTWDASPEVWEGNLRGSGDYNDRH